MQIGSVVGHAVSSIKHRSFQGWRLVVVQLLTSTGKPDGEPILAVDGVGASNGCSVILTNDGLAARQMLGSKDSPVRWMVMGIVD